jgi:hypothetical protein
MPEPSPTTSSATIVLNFSAIGAGESDRTLACHPVTTTPLRHLDDVSATLSRNDGSKTKEKVGKEQGKDRVNKGKEASEASME